MLNDLDGRTKWRLHRDRFSVINNELAAYWLGFIAADGCIIGTKRVAIVLAEKDRKHLEKYAVWMGDKPVKYIDKKFPAVQYTTDARQIAQDLIDKGIGHLKTARGFRLQNVPQEMLPHFIRGLFDGDGNVLVQTRKYKKARDDQSLTLRFTVEVSVGDWLIEYLWSQGIKATAFPHHTTPYIRELFICTSEAEKLYNLMYNNATVYLERKKEKAEGCLEFRRMRGRQRYRAPESIFTKDRLVECLKTAASRGEILTILDAGINNRTHRILREKADEFGLTLPELRKGRWHG